jgi:hypothetical protein
MSGSIETGPQAHSPSLRLATAAIWRRFVAALLKPEGRDALEERVFDMRASAEAGHEMESDGAAARNAPSRKSWI